MWFAAKCIFRHKRLSKDNHDAFMYEERITIVDSESVEWAIIKAENEAKKYAESEYDCEYINYIDCYQLSVLDITDKSEVYSLMRSSKLEPDDYISHYYQDGSERSQKHFGFEHDIDADIFAIGEFKDTIVDYLEYNKRYYQNLKNGSKVVVSSIFYVNGEERTKILAECLGIDHFNVNQHEIDTKRINFFKLEKEFDEDEVATFKALYKAGFSFYFMMYFNDDGSDYLTEHGKRN